MNVTCVDCGTEIRHKRATTVEVFDHNDDGLGYTTYQAPACRRCALERRGYECDHCGQLHETNRAAYECCIGDSKAPDCPECGRRMEIGAAGYGPAEGMSITWAECECCPVGWGRFTGWEMTDNDRCKHVDDNGGERR